MTKHQVKIGRMLLLSHGAYSSYQRLSWFVVVQDFCPEDQLAEFMETQGEDKSESQFYGPHGRFDYNKFLAWLNRKGLMVEVDEFFDEWHLGDYGQAKEVMFMPRSQSNTGVDHG